MLEKLRTERKVVAVAAASGRRERKAMLAVAGAARRGETIALVEREESQTRTAAFGEANDVDGRTMLSISEKRNRIQSGG